MTKDLVAALREAREFVRKRYLTMGDKEANELIAHIDAALSAASGEASGYIDPDNGQYVGPVPRNDHYAMDGDPMRRRSDADVVDEASGPTPNEVKLEPGWLLRDVRQASEHIHPDHRPAPSEAPNPAGLSRKSREILNGDAYEAPNVGMETFDEQTIDGVQVMSEAPNVERFLKQVHLAEDCWQPMDGIDPRDVLAALDSARAEGIAAERERIAKWFEDMWIEERGPDWGLASQDERRAWADNNRRVLRYAALIRKVKP